MLAATALTATLLGAASATAASATALSGFASPLTSSPPSVIGMTPSEGQEHGKEHIKIHGTNLTGATAVRFGSTNATSFTVESAKWISAIDPPGAGVVDVTVSTPAGTSAITTADQFKYNSHPPGVSGISPRHTAAAGGAGVNISGVYLLGASSVAFGSVDAPSFTVNSETSITAVAPAETVGQVSVHVTTPYGTSADEFCAESRPCVVEDHFTFQEPTITELSSTSGPATGGAELTITGTGFALGTSQTMVKFGSTEASSVDCTSITSCLVITPAHKAKTEAVQLKVDGMTSGKKSTAPRYTFE